MMLNISSHNKTATTSTTLGKSGTITNQEVVNTSAKTEVDQNS
jgi:hypothetical protein